MEQNQDYSWILQQYPNTISKDQFYRICHISKRTAALLLEHGLVPCINSGKRTRQYTILTSDVVEYLREREINPEKFRLPEGSYVGKQKKTASKKNGNRIDIKIVDGRAEAFYTALAEPYPDVLTVGEVSAITGYSAKAVHKWCNSGKLTHFYIQGKFRVPKSLLVSFMLSSSFAGVKFKGQQQKKKLLSMLAKCESATPDRDS